MRYKYPTEEELDWQNYLTCEQDLQERKRLKEYYKFDENARPTLYEVNLKKKAIPRLRRPCKKCDKMFTPSGKGCWVCNHCLPSNRRKRAENQYKKIKSKKVVR